MGLTAPQRRALAYLAERSDPGTDGRYVSPRALARHLWPDSPAWQRRTRVYGRNANGALGGTMPMKAAQVLHRLAAQGLARDASGPANGYVSQWHVTDSGLRALREQ